MNRGEQGFILSMGDEYQKMLILIYKFCTVFLAWAKLSMYLDALFTMLLKIIPYLFNKSIGIKFRKYLDSPGGGAIY